MSNNKRYGDEQFYYEIAENLGTISTTGSGWSKEVNLVSWRGAQPKLDIREWSEDHEKMSRGLTLTTAEAVKLTLILQDFYKEELQEYTKAGEE